MSLQAASQSRGDVMGKGVGAPLRTRLFGSPWNASISFTKSIATVCDEYFLRTCNEAAQSSYYVVHVPRERAARTLSSVST